MFRKLHALLRDDGGHRPLWKNFLQSMGLLAVAMMIALYSTNTARSGDTLSTVAAALAALVIAAWVGIRFVPQLARGVDWAWIPGLAHYRVTRDGGIFLGAFLVVLAAAINTRNNLLYMVLSALLAVIVLSGLLSSKNFKSLKMELILPERAFAGETLPLAVRIQNHRLAFPAFSLQTAPPGGEVFFPLIQPQATILHQGKTQFPRRGRYRFEKLRAASRFPFGFFLKARNYPIAAECLCYPKIVPLEQFDVSIADILGTHQRAERGLGTDLHTIRNYQPSDSARHVHWKATAKTATLKTREFAAEDRPCIVLAFDRYGLPRDADRFEELVSRAASLAFHLTRAGTEVQLISDDWASPEEASEAALDAILSYLALVEMSPLADPPVFGPEAGGLQLSLRWNEGVL